MSSTTSRPRVALGAVVALIAPAIPVLAVIWFVGAASLSGALGSPF